MIQLPGDFQTLPNSANSHSNVRRVGSRSVRAGVLHTFGVLQQQPITVDATSFSRMNRLDHSGSHAHSYFVDALISTLPLRDKQQSLANQYPHSNSDQFQSALSSDCLSGPKESVMSNKSMHSLKLGQLNNVTGNYSHTSNSAVEIFIRASLVFFFLLTFCLAFTGCGSNGYAGGGIVSLSKSAVTIDAGQSFSVTSTLSGTPRVSWALSSTACNASACGSLSATVGSSVTYTAPAGITSPMMVTLTAAVTGTTNHSTVNITVNPDPTISGNPPTGTVGVSYTTTFAGAGGTAPLTWSLVGGALPTGLSFNATTGVLSGTPTAVGSYKFMLQIVDSSDVPFTVTAQETITITASLGTTQTVLTLTSLPGATVGVPYSGTLGATGGTSPYSCSISAGTLPVGLTLSGCLISGTPTVPGTSNLTATVTDSSNPVGTTTGPETLTVSPSALSLTLSSLPNGTVGVPYTATIGVAGGTSPYSCAITAGALPAGLTVSGCVVSGTPTVAGTANLTVKATDSSSTVETTTGPVSLTVLPAPLSLTLSSLPDATVGIPYTATIGVAGGTAPYSCLVTAGLLPAGLSISGCVVIGTPTVAGTANLTVKATDSSSTVETTSGPVSLTVLPANVVLTLTSPPNATVGTPYTGTIGVNGGTAPYSCTITAGTLPAGLTASGCVVSGTPTTAGTANLTVKATDTSSPTNTTTGPVALTVSAASATLTLTSPPNATVATPYSGSIGVNGGTAPYTCTITAGTLPAGLTANNCLITGTPTTAGTANLTVKATDSSTPVATTTGPITLTVSPISKLSLTGSVPNAILGVPYTQTLTATGGVSPYSYQITSGALPAGLSLSTGGVISGTPTAPGASSFTVTATDTESTPQTASLPLVLLVVYPTTPNDPELTGPYAYLFQGYDDVLSGVLAYQTATVGSFTADGTGVISSGELDANHQASNPTGNTISSNQFLGTYTIGTDNRGMMTITTLNADGTTAATSTYAISVKAPVSPSTISTQADLIEYDNANLQGTRGSGTMLAQQTAAFTAGLNGSYVFGLSGDAPCLPACTAGLVAGPAAAVGQFTASSSSVVGTGDSNNGATNYHTEVLGGSFTPADGNGRLSLTMTTENTPTSYPSDYAVYLVNSSQSFVLSTDKHSSFILLAGSTQLQTQSSFSNASMSGPFIGYENSATNPGLVTGLVLENVLNLSTATIFRGTATANGNCSITNVDLGGTTGLVNNLTGLLPGLTGLLGNLLSSDSTTGPITCAVASYGRGTLQYPTPTLLGIPTGPAPAPRVFYLSSPAHGYFLESGYAGLGNIEAQTGAPFSTATFDGTFVYGTTVAASLASINSSGFLVANGAGSATSTVDQNVGVGNINLLQLGVTNTNTYTLTDATAGRYTYGTDVIYAITPTRFVLVDTNPLTTSPSITLLY
jgi:ribosomal protein S11